MGLLLRAQLSIDCCTAGGQQQQMQAEQRHSNYPVNTFKDNLIKLSNLK